MTIPDPSTVTDYLAVSKAQVGDVELPPLPGDEVARLKSGTWAKGTSPSAKVAAAHGAAPTPDPFATGTVLEEEEREALIKALLLPMQQQIEAGPVFPGRLASAAVRATEPVVAALLSAAREQGAAAEQRVRKLHHEETVIALRPGCGEDGDCDHEDDCPEDHPYQVCAGCREQLELADTYALERSGAWSEILWPCRTARALDGAS